MNDEIDSTAQRIAARGRDELLARLRPAFSDAAKAHASVLQLSDEQIEQMVQRAADRADGLQWRRALAAVATDELGISLGEALGHPAVVRAQEIIGAPSYEEALHAVAVPQPEEQLGPLPEPEPPPEPEPEEPPAEPEPVRLSAVHLGGVAGLAAGASNIELVLSQHGLDIVRGADEILGRLTWAEIRALDVPSSRSIRRRRRDQRTNLVVRTAHGEASFAIPAVSPDELRAHIEPLVRRYSPLRAGS